MFESSTMTYADHEMIAPRPIRMSKSTTKKYDDFKSSSDPQTAVILNHGDTILAQSATKRKRDNVEEDDWESDISDLERHLDKKFRLEKDLDQEFISRLVQEVVKEAETFLEHDYSTLEGLSDELGGTALKEHDEEISTGEPQDDGSAQATQSTDPLLQQYYTRGAKYDPGLYTSDIDMFLSSQVQEAPMFSLDLTSCDSEHQDNVLRECEEAMLLPKQELLDGGTELQLDEDYLVQAGDELHNTGSAPDFDGSWLEDFMADEPWHGGSSLQKGYGAPLVRAF